MYTYLSAVNCVFHKMFCSHWMPFWYFDASVLIVNTRISLKPLPAPRPASYSTVSSANRVTTSSYEMIWPSSSTGREKIALSSNRVYGKRCAGTEEALMWAEILIKRDWTSIQILMSHCYWYLPLAHKLTIILDEQRDFSTIILVDMSLHLVLAMENGESECTSNKATWLTTFHHHCFVQ